MAEVTIYINGRSYDIACDPGQEGRVVDLATYVDQKLQQIGKSGAAHNDAHLMVLTSLILADELFEIRQGAGEGAKNTRAPANNKDDERLILQVLEHLTKRVEGLASRVQSA